MSGPVLNAREFAGQGSATGGIQEAVDALPKSGGTVYLPPGRYALRRSVQLRSNVTLRGEGAATVITRPKPVIIPLARPSDGSRRRLVLRHARGLAVGDEIHVGDDDSCGWWAGHSIIRHIRGNTLDLEILHGKRRYRYLPKRRAFAANWFPAFWLRSLRGVTIENLTIDGGIRRHKRTICDFVVAAVHSHKSVGLRVTDLTIRNWPGDGIGIQNGRGAIVSGCRVENCAGHGYHPGTGLAESVWRGNLARGNTRDGLFFCLRVTHSVVEGNVFVRNAGNGIGDLSDPDQYNAVVGNVCAENGRHGIEAVRAIGAVIQGNVCRGNSRGAPGKFAGIYLVGHRDCAVTGNVCVDDRPRPTQRLGLVSRDPAGPSTVSENTVR